MSDLFRTLFATAIACLVMGGLGLALISIGEDPTTFEYACEGCGWRLRTREHYLRPGWCRRCDKRLAIRVIQ